MLLVSLHASRVFLEHTCIHILFVTFVIIFKFILIYLLHVLLVYKMKGSFRKKSPTQKCSEMGSFLYIYSIDKLKRYLE